MTPIQNVRIWWDTSVSAYRMSSPYSAELVDVLHKAIPYSDRQFDKPTKIWTFTEKYLTPLQSLLHAIGVKPVVITRAQAETATQGSPAQRQKPLTQVMEEFVKLLPYDAALAAYRKAALAMHPDRGGDMSKMTALNVAWERLQKEVYNQ